MYKFSLTKIKRRLRRFGRKAGQLTVVVATVLSTLGGVPQTAQAIAATVNMHQPPAFAGAPDIPPAGPPVPIISFQMSGTDGGKLQNVVVHLEDVTATGLAPADFIGLNVWQDNGNGTFQPDLDIPLAGPGPGNGCPVSPFVNDIFGNGSLVVSSNPLSADCNGGNLDHTLPGTPTWYFVTIKASPSWGTNPADTVAAYMFGETADQGDPPGAVQSNTLFFPPVPPAPPLMRFPAQGGLGSPAGACNNNNQVDQGEMCDGTDLNGLTCATLPGAPFTGGTLSCLQNCTYDVSACTGGGGGGGACGNGVIEFFDGEVCDGLNLDNMTCSDFGYDGGALNCSAFCGWDFSGCTGQGSVCGNGTPEAGEECDDGNTANGDGCNSQCRFEGTGTQCFEVQDQPTCNSTPGCEWDPGQLFCVPTTNPCNNHLTSETCNTDPGCFWDPVGSMCVMDMAGGYPAHPADEIFSFPQPFNNAQHPLTDGDPYSLGNRPPTMMIGVPRSWDAAMAPLLIGLSEAPTTAPATGVDGSVQLWRYDDIAASWSNVTTSHLNALAPAGPPNEWIGTTHTPLDPNTIYRTVVKGLTKQSGGADFAGQTNACPDDSGDACWTATYKTGQDLMPGGDYQGGGDCTVHTEQPACDLDPACFWDTDQCVSNFMTMGCQAGDKLNVMWPFEGAQGVDPKVLANFDVCTPPLDISSATATFIELDGPGGNPSGPTVPGMMFQNGMLQIEPTMPLAPNTPYRLSLTGADIGDPSGPLDAQTVNFETGAFGAGGPMPGGMLFGDGRLTVNLSDGTNPVTAGGNGAGVVVACGDLTMPEMPQGPEPIEPNNNSFFMDGMIPTGQSSVTIHGLPTPSAYTGDGDNPFANPCKVFLRPDTQSLTMTDQYSSSLEAWTDYLVNEGTLPMPPMQKFGQILISDDDDQDSSNAGPNAQTVTLKVAAVVPGSLSGTVCLDDDASGDADTCGAGDTILSGVKVNVFPMMPPGFGAPPDLSAISDGNGDYSFASLNGGQHMVEVWGDPSRAQNINYFGSVTINGVTAHDVVINLGNTMTLTLLDPGCWEDGAPVHYGFHPTLMTFNSHPVFGELQPGDFANPEPGMYMASIRGFGSGSYSGNIEVPGCLSMTLGVDGDLPGITYGPSPQEKIVPLSAGLTVSGQVRTLGSDAPVADFTFGAHTEFDPQNPQKMGKFTGTRTDGSGNFTLSGLEAGDWFFESFEGHNSGSGRSFASSQGSLASDGSYTVTGSDDPLTLYLRQDKRVNITVTDGINPVPDAMIDINCANGKMVHLGHSDGVWTFLPADTTCNFSVWPRWGSYQPLENVAIDILPGVESPQNVSLSLNSRTTGLGAYGGSRFFANKTHSYPGGAVTYTARLRGQQLSDLNGHNAIFTYPAAALGTDGSISAATDWGTCDSSTPGQVSCALSIDQGDFAVDSFFDVTYTIQFGSDFTGGNVSTSLTMNSTPTDIGFVNTEMVQLTLQGPNVVAPGAAWTAYGDAFPNANLTLSYLDGDGNETTLGTTVMPPGSTWYSFRDMTIADAGDYTLKVRATAPGVSKTVTQPISVGGTAPRLTDITFTANGTTWSNSPLTGIPSGQLFEGDAFSVCLDFNDTMTGVTGTFLGTSHAFSLSEGSWCKDFPSGWTGYGNAEITVRGSYDGTSQDYGPVAEVLVLIDPSGYVYDTADGNRIADLTATVYQLVDGEGNAITTITGADVDTSGAIEDDEELASSGSVVLLNDGEGVDCTGGLSPTGCHWSVWDATTSGQVNPQLTDEDGKYGWNVPQGWYRVAFQKAGAYSLSYSRDVYVPPAETTLNLDLGSYDIAGPSVLSVSPNNGASGVARNVLPVITFSEAMLASTMNTNNVKLLSGGTQVTATVSYFPGNNTVRLTPSANLAASTEYTIRVTTGAKDDTSNALAATYESTFTTATTADTTAPVSTSSVATGSYASAQAVSLSATDSSVACPDCTIYYTLDGTAPTTSSAVYSSSLLISSTTTVRFFARDAAGNSEAPDNTRVITIQQQVPTAPTGLAASGMPQSISLNWNDVSGATSYKVYRSATSGSGYTEIGTPANSLYADYSGLTVGVTYYYKVAAVNGAGDSPLSAEVSAAPLPGGGGGGGGAAPSASVVLNAPNGGQSLAGGSTYTIAWTASGSLNSLRLSYSLDGGSAWVTIAEDEANDGVYSWTVPNVNSSNALVRVEAMSGSTVMASAQSRAAFSIAYDEDAPEQPEPELYGSYNPTTAKAASPTINADKNLETADGTQLLCVPGTLIKGRSSAAVYYCGADGKRYVFPNEDIYFSWYADFSGVIVYGDSELASIMLGGNVTHRPGTRMVKIQSDPKTYAVAPGGVLRWVQTEAVAEALYGPQWNTFIDDVSVAFWVNYVIGDPITEADLGL